MRAKAIYVGKLLARRLVWGPSDLLRRLRGGDDLLPPRGLSFVGPGDFRQTGSEFLRYFVELGGLERDARVLDMGCGVGRMAVPLVDYLDQGSYAGFDVGREMVGWCRRHIAARRPDFEFAWAPVYNRKYNPFGEQAGTEFRFPYPDASFDFAFATSLFTHLLGDEVRHYLAETGRVLRPGGTALLTFFLLTPEAQRQVEAGLTAHDFRHPAGAGRTTDPRCPEEAVAFPEEEVRAMLAAAGLRLREPVYHGAWANAPEALTMQDVVVVERDGPPARESATPAR